MPPAGSLSITIPESFRLSIPRMSFRVQVGSATKPTTHFDACAPFVDRRDVRWITDAARWVFRHATSPGGRSDGIKSRRSVCPAFDAARIMHPFRPLLAGSKSTRGRFLPLKMRPALIYTPQGHEARSTATP